MHWLGKHDPDNAYIAPWIDWYYIMGGMNDELALKMCAKAVKACDAVVLVGGTVSSGMDFERSTAEENGKVVMDLTFLGTHPPKDIESVVSSIMHTYGETLRLLAK